MKNYEIAIKESKPIKCTKEITKQTDFGPITFIFVTKEEKKYHLEVKF